MLPGQLLADLGDGRVRAALQQRVRGHDQARRAEATLHGAGIDEGALQVCRRGRLGETLDGDDRAVDGARRQHEAGAHEVTVDEHRARPALPLLAGALRAHQPEPLAQHVEQALPHPRVGDVVRSTVDVQLVVGAHGDPFGNARRSRRRDNTSTARRR